MRYGDGERGLTLVTFAITIPILLLLVLGAMDFFLYYRSSSIVERSIAEASKALIAASPSSKQNNFSLQSVKNKQLVRSSTGGDTEKNIHSSFKKHGAMFRKPGSRFSNYESIPFKLENRGTLLKDSQGVPKYRAGVQYLPLISTATCLEARNETSQSYTTDCKEFGELTYQLPSIIDFDGDGREDLAFFFMNRGGDDWWIIPSSSGTLFSRAMRFDTPPTAPGSAYTWLPCPADYDGDGRTDVCIAGTNRNSGSLAISMKLSSTFYSGTFKRTFKNIGAGLALPVPGRWQKGEEQDRFAVVLVEGKTYQKQHSTLVFPLLKQNRTTKNFDMRGSFKEYNSEKLKPRPGRAWRPTFGDHDGNGVLDVGWFTWSASHPVFDVAGTPEILSQADSSSPALNSKLMPWKIHYPNSEESPGLYVVERYNHRVSIITPGPDGIIGRTKKDSTSDDTYTIIAGGLNTKGETEIKTSDPLLKGLFDTSPVPTNSYSSTGCANCESGGGYNGENKPAKGALLNSPRDVATSGRKGSALFIADYGNYRVRKVFQENSSDKIDGKGNEKITTIVGGTVAADANCPSTIDGTEPTEGNASRPWNKYALSDISDGLHPTCVSVRPISLALIDSDKQTQLFVGDENGVVFRVDPGSDGEFDRGSDERIYRYLGEYKRWSTRKPGAGRSITPRTTRIGFPESLRVSWKNKSQDPTLYVAIRNSNVPGSRNFSNKPHGGIIYISSGSDEIFGTSDDYVKESVGTWEPTTESPNIYDTSEKVKVNLKNPTSLAVLDSESKTPNLFLSSWWIGENSPALFEQSLLHFYSRADKSTAYRWINNQHAQHWGAREPDTVEKTEKLSLEDNISIANTPVQPTGGVAISPDGKYLYFSETLNGTIRGVLLDTDGDGTADFEDEDSDGDRVKDSQEKGTNERDPYYAQSTEGFRPIDAFQDAKMWARSLNGSLSLSKNNTSKFEWLLDRFSGYESVPFSAEAAISPETTPAYKILNSSTIAVATGRGALSSIPVWPGGISRTTEYNSNTGIPLLAPVVMSSKNPMPGEIKSLVGYDQCQDWSLNEFEKIGLEENGSPISTCGRDPGKPLPNTSLRAGVRRAHLAQWKGHWHNLSLGNLANDQAHISFIDWDGDGVRNPAAITTEQAKKLGRPLMVHIGNLFKGTSNNGLGINSCPGSFAIADLNNLWEALRRTFSPPLNKKFEPQYSCNKGEKFFTSTPVPSVSIMADHHAEWSTKSEFVRTNLEAQESARLTQGDGISTGPVVETAYKVLEQSIKVKKRNAIDEPFSADVSVSPVKNDKSRVNIEVRYVYPFSPFIGKLLGRDSVVIKRNAERTIYNFGEGS